MSKYRKSLPAATMLLVAAVVSGCAHYQITDPTTGRTYYSADAQRAPYSGAVVFTDAKTGETLTLQNTQLKQISREEFERAVRK